MLVNVIGMGYIGLPTALMMASHGVNVIGTDYNKKLVEQLQTTGKVFEEKGLSELFDEAGRKGIRFSDQYQKADIYIVSVPTPYLKKSRKIDPKYVIAACKSVLETCDDGAILVVRAGMTHRLIVRPSLPEPSITVSVRSSVSGTCISPMHRNVSFPATCCRSWYIIPARSVLTIWTPRKP